MTRDRQILKAARDYVSGVTLSSPSNVIHFEYGAKWADEHPNLTSLWHDANEEPSKAYPIMIEINDDIDPTYDVITVDGKDEKFWKFLASDRDITRWAYIKDLLPKTK